MRLIRLIQRTFHNDSDHHVQNGKSRDLEKVTVPKWHLS